MESLTQDVPANTCIKKGMSKSIATIPRYRFGSADVPISADLSREEERSSSSAMKLLVLFVLLLYSGIGAIYPGVESVRPALVVALGAVVFTFIESAKNGTSFRMSAPEGMMLVLFLGVTVLSTFGAIYLTQAAVTTMNFAKVVIIYVVIENIVTTTDRLRKVMLTMVIGGLIPASGTIYHFLHHVVKDGRAAYYGTFGNPNEDAYGLVILVPIAAVLAWRAGHLLRLFLVGSIGLYLIATYTTFSRGGLLGLVAVLALFGWKQKSFVVKALLIAMVAGGVIVAGMFWGRKDDFSNISGDTTVNQRIATIKAGFEMFRDRPLFGVGPGDSLVAYPLYVPKDAHCGCQDQLVVHNAFIQVLSETGALGFIPFMILLGAAVLHAWQLQRIATGELQICAMGLELALWGFIVCGLSGGFSWSWFPYILIGLIVAARQMAIHSAAQAK